MPILHLLVTRDAWELLGVNHAGFRDEMVPEIFTQYNIITNLLHSFQSGWKFNMQFCKHSMKNNRHYSGIAGNKFFALQKLFEINVNLDKIFKNNTSTFLETKREPLYSVYVDPENAKLCVGLLWNYRARNLLCPVRVGDPFRKSEKMTEYVQKLIPSWMLNCSRDFSPVSHKLPPNTCFLSSRCGSL